MTNHKVMTAHIVLKCKKHCWGCQNIEHLPLTPQNLNIYWLLFSSYDNNHDPMALCPYPIHQQGVGGFKLPWTQVYNCAMYLFMLCSFEVGTSSFKYLSLRFERHFGPRFCITKKMAKLYMFFQTCWFFSASLLLHIHQGSSVCIWITHWSMLLQNNLEAD